MTQLDETEATPECREAWQRIGDFVAGGLLGEPHVALRAHLDQCEECMGHYRDAVNTTSRVVRSKRDRRQSEEALERDERLRDAGYELPPAPRTNWNRLRTMVYPAFFIFVMILLTRAPQDGEAGVLLLSGEAVAADSELLGERIPIGRGDWCRTGAGSRVQLDIHEFEVMLGAHTRVSIESLEPARLRFTGGRIEPVGTCTISTSLGVLDFTSATAILALDENGLDVLLEGGSAVFSGAGGEEALTPGASFRVDL